MRRRRQSSFRPSSVLQSNSGPLRYAAATVYLNVRFRSKADSGGVVANRFLPAAPLPRSRILWVPVQRARGSNSSSGRLSAEVLVSGVEVNWTIVFIEAGHGRVCRDRGSLSCATAVRQRQAYLNQGGDVQGIIEQNGEVILLEEIQDLAYQKLRA